MKTSEFAASWWVNAIRDVNPNYFQLEDCENEEQGLIISLLGSIFAKVFKPTENDLFFFQRSLEKEIEENLKKEGVVVLHGGLSETGTIYEIAKRYEIPLKCIPWSVTMYVIDNKVSLFQNGESRLLYGQD